MSIQEELDKVREQKFRKDMQDVYDKLNEVCLELCDMRLEDFAEIMEEQNLYPYDDIPVWYYNPDFRNPNEE